jgi:hypothetical protein
MHGEIIAEAKKSEKQKELPEIEAGLKLGLIGFVFPASAESFIFIFLCINSTYVHFGFSEIGFVFPASA